MSSCPLLISCKYYTFPNQWLKRQQQSHGKCAVLQLKHPTNTDHMCLYMYSFLQNRMPRVCVCVCAYIIATNIVIFCISSVQISTTVLRELPLYWANGIKGLSVWVLYVFEIHFVKKPQLGSRCRYASWSVCAFDLILFPLKPTHHTIHELCDPAL